MPYQPKPGEISLFENEKAGHERAPDHQGYVIAHRDIKAGEKLSLSLWVGKPDGARSFGGVMADVHKAGAAKPVDPDIGQDLFGAVHGPTGNHRARGRS